MTLKRMAIIGAHSLVENLAVWDGVAPWPPSAYSVDVTNIYCRVGMALFYRPAGVSYNYNIIIDGNSHSDWSYSQGFSAKYGFELSTLAPLTQYDMMSQATSGYTTVQLTQRAPNYIDTLWDVSKPNFLCIWELTNDLASQPIDAATARAHLIDYCTGRKAVNPWPIIVGTCMARSAPNTVNNPNYETERIALNQMIRDDLANGETYLDAIADVGAAPLLQNPLNNTYFITGLHLQNAGMDIAKVYFQNALDSLV